MIDAILLVLVLGVPAVLALVVMDTVADALARQRSSNLTLPAAGVFWDRPARTVGRASADRVRVNLAHEAASVAAPRPAAIGHEPAFAPGGPEPLPAAV